MISLNITALATSAVLLSALPGYSLTFVLDFSPSFDYDGDPMTAFDPTPYSFDSVAALDVPTLILNAVSNHYLSYPTIVEDALSPLAAGKELDIDFVLGSEGVAPSNGDTDYFVMSIGESLTRSSLGTAFYESSRGAFVEPAGTNIGSIFTDNIASLSSLADEDGERINLIAGTLSHEIGHTLGLGHPSGAEANPGTSIFGVMATGAFPTSMPNNQRLLIREFSYVNFEDLVDSVGVRDIGQVSSVPIPAPIALLGGGLCLLGAVKRRRAA